MGLLRALDKFVSSENIIPVMAVGPYLVAIAVTAINADREEYRANLIRQVNYLVAGEDRKISFEEANSALAELTTNRVSEGKELLFGQDGNGVYLEARNSKKHYVSNKALRDYIKKHSTQQ